MSEPTELDLLHPHQDNDILDISSDEEDILLILGFDPEKARAELLNYRQTTHIVLSADQQKELGLEVGVNVSADQPWKQVRKEIFQDCLPGDALEFAELKEHIRRMEDEQLILVGYAPELSTNGDDMFVVFNNERVAKEASEIIQKMEAFERQRAKNTVFKAPRAWKSLGSEHEVDRFLLKQKNDTIDLELQSVYPVKHSKHAEFSFRKVADARDGYVELIPGRLKFENVMRKRIDASVQSAPSRVATEQQTDPTFPTNAWSQYLYEINEGLTAGASETKAISSEEADIFVEEPVVLPPDQTNEDQSDVKASGQVEELLKTLEFNQIDMYRNDYPFISTETISKPKDNDFEELFCFIDFEKCAKRYVASIDWHPQYSGVFVATYTFKTISTVCQDNAPTIDEVNRAVYEENPVLVWSFDDLLNAKLELKAPREVTTVKFCPYNGDLIVGGTVNGQVIIWDITDRLNKVEHPELVSPERAQIRAEMHALLDWSKQTDSDRVVKPTAISSLEHSQHDVITTIKWLAQNIKCDPNGRFEVRDEFKNRIFMTSSFDGTICVWDLDWRPADSAAQRKKNKFLEKMPAELQEAESVFKLVDKVFHPIFRLVLNLPVSCVSMDEAEFVRQPISVPQKITIRTRLQYDAQPVAAAFENRLKCGTFTCDLVAATWEGFEFDQGGVMNEEHAKMHKFEAVHDGVIVVVERNPFIKTVDITVGGSIFALWSTEWAAGPLLWRERPSRLTAMKWSLNRPAAFYVIREDGILEAWDLLAKCDRPILEKTIGGRVLTTLSQHIFHLPQPSLAIGDYNSSVRMFLIPPYFAEPIDNEIDQMTRFIDKKILRKQTLAEFDSNWRGCNQELLAAKKLAQDDAHYAMLKKQRAEKDRKYYEERASAEASRRQTARDSKKIVYDLPDKLDQKWNEMHYKRLLNIIMERKSINQEELTRSIKPIKDKEEYESDKQKAFEANYAMVANELAKIRSTLLPAPKARTSREDTVRQMLGDFLAYSPKYDDVAKDLEEQADRAPSIPELTFPDILMRGKQRREIISKSLGGTTAHTYRLERKDEDAGVNDSESSITKGRESSELKRRSVTFSMDVKSEKS